MEIFSQLSPCPAVVAAYALAVEFGAWACEALVNKPPDALAVAQDAGHIMGPYFQHGAGCPPICRLSCQSLGQRSLRSEGVVADAGIVGHQLGAVACGTLIFSNPIKI